MWMWKKEDQLVALAEQVLTSNSRMSVTRLPEGTMLSLMLAEREDAGLYTCQLSALQSVHQGHEVVVRGRERQGDRGISSLFQFNIGGIWGFEGPLSLLMEV